MHKKLFLFAICLLSFDAVCFGQNWDIDLLKELNLHRNRSLDGFFILITDYAAPLAYSIPLALLVYAFLKKKKTLQEKSFYIIQSALLALALSTLLKQIIARPRPFVSYPFLEKLSTGGSGSFPSGHTSDAFTLAASLSFAFPRWYVILPAYAWAGAVGYSRMHLGVHYPSDVAASIVLGTLCSFVTYQLKNRGNKKRIQSEPA